MLFRKDIEPRCVYCRHGGSVDNNTVVCRYKGIMDGGACCRRFAYDPLRRVPAKPAQLSVQKLTEDDFKI